MLGGASLAISRSSYFLTREAKKNAADLYIGHNLGALGAAVKAAKRHHAKCGFDAEDFHRNELTDDENDPRVKLVVHLEQKYIPQLDYLTASSPQIADAYALLFNRKVTTLLNAFPAKKEFNPVNNRNGNLKLFWFSQTIGPNRGLETIIEAINIANIPIELHLLGFHPDTAYNNSLSKLAKDAGQNCFLYFHDPVPPDSIFDIAILFDIGLAAEPGFCINNNIALSNKLFTYLQSGLAVVASNTKAQKAFLVLYPDIGELYSTAKGLADILVAFHKDRTLLYLTKEHNIKIGYELLNWEYEREKFLRLLREILDITTTTVPLK